MSFSLATRSLQTLNLHLVKRAVRIDKGPDIYTPPKPAIKGAFFLYLFLLSRTVGERRNIFIAKSVTGSEMNVKSLFVLCQPDPAPTLPLTPSPAPTMPRPHPSSSTANTGRWWMALTVNASCSCIYKDPNIAVVAGPGRQTGREGETVELGEGKRRGGRGRKGKRSACEGHESKRGRRDTLKEKKNEQ